MTREDLLALFRRKVDELGQAEVTRRLGRSPSSVSQVYHGTYKADTGGFLQRVEEVFGATTVGCPVLGEISLGLCAEERRRPFANTNRQRVALWRACQECPHNDKGGRK